jgi:protein required for attachment to host cells
MAKERVLVACPARARLLERDTVTGALRPLRTILAADVPADPPSTESQDRLRSTQSPQRRRHLRFAGVLASQLAKSLRDDDCDRITLVSACPFLGALRACLTPAVRSAVACTINMDLVDAPLAAIASELAQHRADSAGQPPRTSAHSTPVLRAAVPSRNGWNKSHPERS